MTTFTSIRQYRTYLSKIRKNIVVEAMRVDRETAKNMKKSIKRNAPVKTGATRAGIRFRRIEKGYKVVSFVPGVFKQNMFANRTEPYRTLTFKTKNRFYKVPQKVIYGKSAISRGGKPIAWTGKPNFFDLGVRSEIPNYRNQLKKITRNTVKMSA